MSAVNQGDKRVMKSTEEKAPYQIFISYRRDGGESLAALLHDRLERIGFTVFYDVESLRSGNFNEALLGFIEKCQDVLLVLPPGGLDRCITDEKDWVRREIVHALKCHKNIIPVMMRNFSFPDNLPDDMKPIEKQNGVSATMEYFDAVIEKIVTHRLKSKPADRNSEEERRIKELKEKIQDGDTEAMNELGTLYERGSVNVPQNLKKAFQYYESAQEENDAARFNLADVYERCSTDLTLLHEYGINLDTDPDDPHRKETFRLALRKKALEFYKKAAQNHFAPALYKMGMICEESATDLEQAFRYYKEAASQGFLPALNAVGWMYRNGIGITQNTDMAKQYYKEAADKKYAPAIYNYAYIIEAEEPEKAMTYYKQVAFGEHALGEAAYALGRMYEDGMRDIRNAINCYEQAVRCGVGEAQTDLERCRDTLI